MRTMENLEEYTNKVIEEFEAISKDAERVQRETLKSILEDSALAEYLQSLGLNGKTDPESFKAIIPLVTHDDLEPYIKRIFDGDNSPILTGKPITAMSLSSGTTQGKSKYIPWNDTYMESTVQIFHTSFSFRNREFPIKNGKALSFNYSSKQSQTKGGIKTGSATSHLFRHKGYTQAKAAINSQICSPKEVIFGTDFQQSLYCHLLSGLIFRDQVQFVSSPFAHSIVQAFRTFEQVWEELCNDIREGVLNSKVTDPLIRTAMYKILKPDPELANLIHEICTCLSNWYGVIQELFPNAKYVVAVMTGTMETYLKRLRHHAGEMPLVTSDYGSSEGITYVNPKPLGLTEVKAGEEYELVMTTRTGLYRYRLGDVIKVTGFYNSIPELKFIRRSNILLTVNIDKNTENDLYLSVVAASKFDETSEEVLGKCCNCLDKSFVDPAYAYSRKVNHIGPIELGVVKRGTFQKILEHYAGGGASVSKFKIPRCVPPTNSKLLQILNENVGKNYVSTAFN
ncbi:hypothetical protein TanjilG_11217 [Lupinus angustifolius]|uniref:Uncharacterized protein n=1 Tax=Lupinus angustifolius TaxID=3871 RepID=A0A1J7HPE9_LUPAN|nr:hypothetical protein TanjilG_11217 [Lupinus angustifolius]